MLQHTWKEKFAFVKFQKNREILNNDFLFSFSSRGSHISSPWIHLFLNCEIFNPRLLQAYLCLFIAPFDKISIDIKTLWLANCINLYGTNQGKLVSAIFNAIKWR